MTWVCVCGLGMGEACLRAKERPFVGGVGVAERSGSWSCRGDPQSPERERGGAEQWLSYVGSVGKQQPPAPHTQHGNVGLRTQHT